MSGRGAYYKAKYGGGRGGGGRGRGGGGYSHGGHAGHGQQPPQPPQPPSGGGTADSLINLLQSLDNQSYPRYHSIETTTGWVYANRDSINGEPLMTLYCNRTQSDPYARPTRVEIKVPPTTAGYHQQAYATDVRRTALGGLLARRLYQVCRNTGGDQGGGGKGGWKGPKGGDVQVTKLGQNVVKQSAVEVDSDGGIIVRVTVNLPARGRSIMAGKAVEIFSSVLPTMIRSDILTQNNSEIPWVLSVEDQNSLRRQLVSNGLVGFVANGSVLPRVSGADDRPMEGAVPFVSPPTMEVTLRMLNGGREVKGMGVRKGITVVVGGGFHGKSTMLQALQGGVYDKVVGDGREGVVMVEDGTKVKAEDGRMVQGVDIERFIKDLPGGRDTSSFSTLDASGSTSQAAFIIESLESGSRTLLFDEDTCATNFMIRDGKMAALVNAEPIRPFVSRVTGMRDAGISSVMVIGGAGDYLNVADRVIGMKDYVAYDLTDRAKEVVGMEQFKSQVPPVSDVVSDWNIGGRSIDTTKLRPEWKCSVRSKEKISYGDEIELEIGGMEQVESKEMSNGILLAMHAVARMGGVRNLRDAVEEVLKRVEAEGVGKGLGGGMDGGIVLPRVMEVMGAIGRLRLEGLLKGAQGGVKRMKI